MRKRVEELVRKVKNLLHNTYEGELQCLELIDSLQRLGVGYHFEEEIDKRLREIHHHNGKFKGNDLQAVALKFRLFRQHGYNVTSDVFSKYKDDEGKFKSNLVNNVRGLLSLYEACFLSTHEEIQKHHLQNLSDNDMHWSYLCIGESQGQEQDII
ncbi:Beta-cubebene synthase [Dendrobium catenatum]|uniref:Beta-cubebene synthase n=1 Tax=Dendrobium catenatum TaxID=906689 RepID=A0A2I0WXJ6_9ASPA|nr:Beta-cubebene synthase [Dendrobium catenatum]